MKPAREQLYTAEMLGLAMRLADFPLADDLTLHGEAKSPVCGSSLRLGLTLNSSGEITQVGISASACAVGQASAALFAIAAPGKTRAQIAEELGLIKLWLEWPSDYSPPSTNLSPTNLSQPSSPHHSSVPAEPAPAAPPLPQIEGADFAVIAKARDYPARHGAIMLAWVAALAAFDREPEAG